MSSSQLYRNDLEAKRARLAEIKRKRDLREKDFSTTRQSLGERTNVSTAPASGGQWQH